MIVRRNNDLEAISIIGCCVGVAGFIFGLVTLFRNKKTDDTSAGQRDGVLMTEVGYIKAGIDGINRRLEQQEARYVEISNRVSAVEESAKSAHKRIDRIEREGLHEQRN